MSAIDSLTICVTNFQRPEFLDRALSSIKAGGIRRVTVASVMPCPKTVEVIERIRNAAGRV